MPAPLPDRAEPGEPPAARRRVAEPSADPSAVDRRLRRERAKRRALDEHRHERRMARIRFLALIGVLVFVTLFLSLTIWDKIGSLFGL
jgi:hypothetical protein